MVPQLKASVPANTTRALQDGGQAHICQGELQPDDKQVVHEIYPVGALIEAGERRQAPGGKAQHDPQHGGAADGTCHDEAEIGEHCRASRMRAFGHRQAGEPHPREQEGDRSCDSQQRQWRASAPSAAIRRARPPGAEPTPAKK